MLKVLDGALAGKDWVAGEYSIADIAIGPWLRTLRDFYKAADLVGWDQLKHVPAYLDGSSGVLPCSAGWCSRRAGRMGSIAHPTGVGPLPGAGGR